MVRSKCINNTQAAGEFDFIVTLDNRVLLGRKHSFLSAGANVQAAGTMKFRNGKLVKVSNASGHYLPNLEESSNFLRILRNCNVNVDNATLEILDSSGRIIRQIHPNSKIRSFYY